MKILLSIYIIGCMCGLLAHTMLGLKISGYCKRKGIKPPKEHGLERLYSFIRLIIMSAFPIYHYLLLLIFLFYDSEKLEQIIQSKLDERGGE